MDPLVRLRFTLIALLFVTPAGVLGITFTFVNRCDYTVWPGIRTLSDTPKLESTGFELPKNTSRSFQVPPAWRGQLWGRTACNFDGSDQGSCLTGDCSSGRIDCNGTGPTPPATLVECSLGQFNGQDFYDVSVVLGFNLPIFFEATGGSGQCDSTGCVTDLNQQCPEELKLGDGKACQHPCSAFGSQEYCCTGAYVSPSRCTPNVYTEMFKAACPKAYSYAFDDASSTFTCSGADYTVTFCPAYYSPS